MHINAHGQHFQNPCWNKYSFSTVRYSYLTLYNWQMVDWYQGVDAACGAELHVTPGVHSVYNSDPFDDILCNTILIIYVHIFG